MTSTPNLGPIRIEPMLGEVSQHAEVLAAIVRATGVEVREDFNGDDLIAKPGMTAREVHADWAIRRTARQEADRS